MKKRAVFMLWLACTLALGAQTPLPPPFPRTNATRLLDTDRITVWDIVWPKGQPTAIQINDVDIDHRGLAYASDRVGSGLFIFEYTGKKGS